MPLSDRKVLTWTTPISSLDDRPNMSAAELKAAFDSNSGQLQTAHNQVIDDLESSSGSSLIGTTAITGVDGTTIGDQITSIASIADDAKTSASSAQSSATASASSASDSATSAASSAASAANAVSQANTAVSQANTAASTCNTATTNANNATSLANTATNYANAQGDYAKTQGNYAKEKGDYVAAQADQFDSILSGAVTTFVIHEGLTDG